MKRAGPDVSGLGVQTLLQTVLQFIGGLVGEGDGENFPWRNGPENSIRLGIRAERTQRLQVFFRCIERELVRIGGTAEADQILNTPNQDGGFAAAGTGQNQDRPLGCQNRLTLHRVQIREMMIQPGPPGGGIFGFQHSCIHGGYSMLIHYIFSFSPKGERRCSFFSKQHRQEVYHIFIQASSEESAVFCN